MDCEGLIEELKRTILAISPEEVRAAEEAIEKAEHIFCDGFGRSGLCCKGFAMRLMQLGMQCFFVGETTTPAIQKGDLLFICSGSGESQALIAHGRKAKEIGARMVLVTGSPDSTLGRMADIKILISAPKKDKEEGREGQLPMGSLFEETASLLFENMVLDLMGRREETSKSMYQRHANLE